jgi:hypothetical protein
MKTTALTTIVLLLGIGIGLSITGGPPAVGQGTGSAASFAQHHKEVTSLVSPNTLIPIELPVNDQGVMVMVTISGVQVTFGSDAPLPTTPIVFSGFYSKDSITGQTIIWQAACGLENGHLRINCTDTTSSQPGIDYSSTSEGQLSNGVARITLWY